MNNYTQINIADTLTSERILSLSKIQNRIVLAAITDGRTKEEIEILQDIRAILENTYIDMKINEGMEGK